MTQPLLRGFGLAVNRRFIQISKNEQKIAGLLVQQQLIATVYGVVRLYTDLVALYEDVKVKEGTLASAEKLYSDTKAQVDEGTQAPIELTRANAQVFSIRQDLINSRGLLEEQEAIVKNVITRRTDNDPDILNARIIPTDSIDVPTSEEIRPLQDLVGLAFTQSARFVAGRAASGQLADQPERVAQRIAAGDRCGGRGAKQLAGRSAEPAEPQASTRRWWAATATRSNSLRRASIPHTASA